MIWIYCLIGLVVIIAMLVMLFIFAMRSNEQEARKAGIKVGALLVPLVFLFSGCVSIPTPHKCQATEEIKVGFTSWSSMSSPTNSPKCK